MFLTLAGISWYRNDQKAKKNDVHEEELRKKASIFWDTQVYPQLESIHHLFKKYLDDGENGYSYDSLLAIFSSAGVQDYVQKFIFDASKDQAVYDFLTNGVSQQSSRIEKQRDFQMWIAISFMIIPAVSIVELANYGVIEIINSICTSIIIGLFILILIFVLILLFNWKNIIEFEKKVRYCERKILKSETQ